MSTSPTKHSRKYSPSKSSTWLNCPLSTLLNDGSSQETNPQAEFGTQCHELSAALICKSLNIVDFDNEPMSVNEIVKGLDIYSPEMQDLADGYADYVINTVEYEKKMSSSEPLVVVEQYLEMDFDADAGGTLDCGIISSSNGGTLTVIDLKTGRGPVAAFNSETGMFNTQLGIYALYFYKAYKDIYPIKNVRLVIYQPVISNTNDFEMSIEDLLKFETDILIPAVAKTKVSIPEAKSGSYCKWCAGKAICIQRAEDNMKLIKEASKPLEKMTDNEIEKLLPKMDELISFAEDVKESALKKALNGHKWRNFKLVHTKSTRKVSDEDAVIKVCEDAGFDPYAPKKLVGITELTKRLGKDKFNELIGNYLTKQEGAIVLVPSADARDEVIILKEGEKN